MCLCSSDDNKCTRSIDVMGPKGAAIINCGFGFTGTTQVSVGTDGGCN